MFTFGNHYGVEKVAVILADALMILCLRLFLALTRNSVFFVEFLFQVCERYLCCVLFVFVCQWSLLSVCVSLSRSLWS